MAETRPTEGTPFFEFQARNRRATWRLTLAYALVVGGCGFLSAAALSANVFLAPFALVFIPAVLCLGLGALMLLTPATAALADPIWAVGLYPLGIVGGIPTLLPGDGDAVWVIGLVLPLVCWLAVRRPGSRSFPARHLQRARGPPHGHAPVAPPPPEAPGAHGGQTLRAQNLKVGV